METQAFIKNKSHLICFDSDGCVMDTMDIKHFTCFGPCMVSEWGLQDWQEDILLRWNDINLYTMTRGINRFLGLAQALTEIDQKYTPISGIDELNAWVRQSSELSNSALQAAAQSAKASALSKALSWSTSVNAAIARLDSAQKLAYDGAAEGLRAAHENADVAIISSANREAVIEEWQSQKLLCHVNVLMTQENGSKAACIKQLAENRYDKHNVLMVGDAPGDLSAAQSNGVLFYPIIVRHERESWAELCAKALPAFYSNDTEYFARKTQEFLDNLQG